MTHTVCPLCPGFFLFLRLLLPFNFNLLFFLNWLTLDFRAWRDLIICLGNLLVSLSLVELVHELHHWVYFDIGHPNLLKPGVHHLRHRHHWDGIKPCKDWIASLGNKLGLSILLLILLVWLHFICFIDFTRE